jgi:DNA-binding CsgD family transcriptional regulator
MRVQSFDSVVATVYEAATGADTWNEVLCGLADFCGGANAALVYDFPRSGFSGVVTPRADPVIVSEYREHWWTRNPIIDRKARAGLVRDLDDSGREPYLASQFHNEYWRRTGLGAERLFVNIVNDGRSHCCMTLQASVRRDMFSAEARKRFERLVPHVIRAMEIGSRLKKLDFDLWLGRFGRRATGTAAFGVSADARLVYANVVGESMLATGLPFLIHRGRLRLAKSRHDAALQQAINACQSARTQAMTDFRIVLEADRKRAYRIWVAGCAAGGPSVPVPGAGVLVLVEEEIDAVELKIQNLRRAFGLTNAEARLTLEMLACDGRAAAARRCGISTNTARTHLSRIFDKVGVSKQTQLVTVVNVALSVP